MRLLMCCILIAFCVNLYANDSRKNIWLSCSYYTDYDKLRGIDDRSFVIELSACYDNNTIYLYSEKAFHEVHIVVTDASGSMLCEEYTSLAPGVEHVLFIGDAAAGEYTLIMDTEIGRYQGSFLITDE